MDPINRIEEFVVNDLIFGPSKEIACPFKLAGLFNALVNRTRRYRNDAVYMFDQQGSNREIFYVMNLPETYFDWVNAVEAAAEEEGGGGGGGGEAAVSTNIVTTLFGEMPGRNLFNPFTNAYISPNEGGSSYRSDRSDSIGVNEEDVIRSWFSVNWGKSFVMSAPIYTNASGWRYSIRCSPTQSICQMPENNSIRADILRLCSQNCYTICNGLTIAIALHRVGRMRARLLRELLDTIPMPLTYSMYEPELQPYYDNHIVPMVADMPYHYALRGSAMSVIIDMQDRLEADISPTGAYICVDAPGLEVYTSPSQIIFSAMTLDKMRLFVTHWPSPGAGRSCVPAFVELVKGLCRAPRAVWKWWRRPENGPRVLERVLGDMSNELVSYVFNTVMAIHDRISPDHHITVIWRQLLEVAARRGVENPFTLVPPYAVQRSVPLPLLMDVFRKYPAFYDRIEEGVLKEIVRDIENRRKLRKMLALKRAMPYEVFDVMIDYYKRHRTEL